MTRILGNTRLAVTGICVLLLFACVVGIYRYLDGLRWWAPQVDERALGFEERYIYIRRYNPALSSDGGKTESIEGWFPQRIALRQPRRIVVRCTFEPPGRLASCKEISSLGEYAEVDGHGLYVDSTPSAR